MNNAQIIALIGGVITLLFILLRMAKAGMKALSLKTLASLGFITTTLAAMSLTGAPRYGYFILAGQILGMLGDIFLDQKMIHRDYDYDYTNMGFAVFGAGHIVYTIGILITVGASELNYIVSAVAALVVGGFLLFTEKPMKLNYGKFRAPVLLYSVVIGFTTALPASYLLTLDKLPINLLYFLIGMVAFLISDLVLSQIYFKRTGETPLLVAVNYIFYYSAQYLISLSVMHAR